MNKPNNRLIILVVTFATSFCVCVKPVFAQDITSNLVAHWAFEEGSGTTVLDSTSNNHDGTISGNPSWLAAAKIGGGLDFENSDGADRIDVGTFDVSGTGVTVSTWIKPETNGTDQRIISKATSNATADQYWQLNHEVGSTEFRVKAGGITDRLIVTTSLLAGHWYHFVGTYDGTTIRLYQDGIEVGSLVHSVGGAVSTNGAAPVSIGDSPLGGRPYDGMIDEVRVYERALTATDVTTLFSTGWGSRSLLLVTENDGSYTAQEEMRKKQFEDWDYQVTPIHDADSQANYDTAALAADVAYVSEEILSTDLNTKLREAAIGVVWEDSGLDDDMGLSYSGGSDDQFSTQVSISDNTHAITSFLSTGNATLFTSTQRLVRVNGTLASGWQELGQVNGNVSFGVIELGGALIDSTSAAGRRAKMPFGGFEFDWSSLNSDGLQLVQNAIAWAVGNSDGLVGHWKLGESSGTTAADSSGNGNDGTYENSPTLGVDAVYGNGVGFDGTDQHIEIPGSSVLNITQAITVSCWARSASSTWNENGCLISKRDQFLLTPAEGSQAIRFLIFRAGGAWVGTPSFDLSTISGFDLTEWHHYAATYDGATGDFVFYVDGVQREAYSLGFANDINSSTNNVLLGYDNPVSEDRYLDGNMDEVRLYNSALSAEEVAELYGMVGHWKLNETSGTVVTDSSPAGNDGESDSGVVLGESGIRAAAAEFSSSSGEGVKIPYSTSLKPAEAVSIAAWVYAYSAPDYAHIFSDRISTSPEGFRLQLNGDGKVRFKGSTPGEEEIVSTDDLPIGRWVQVIGMYTGSELRLYMDGELVETQAVTGEIVLSAGDSHLGAFPSGSLQWDGLIDDVMFYNRAMTEAEIAEHYGLLGHWTFDEGAGSTIADSTVFANDASFNTGTPEWVDGIYGNALKFDGTNDAATDTVFDPPETGAVSFWVRRADPPISRERPWGVGADYEMWQDTDGLMSFDLSTDGFVGGSITDEPIDDRERWYHLVGLYDSSDDSYSIYINGELHKSGISTFDIQKQPADFLSFGTRTGSTQRFNGAIDDFRIFNRKISVREINALYGRLAHWKLDETSGSVALDSTDHGNDGTLVASPDWTTSGNVDGALDFESSSAERIDAGTFDVSGNEITLMGWVNAEGGVHDGRIIFKSTSNSGTDQAWGLTVAESLEPEFRLSAGGSRGRLSVAGRVSTGRWYHLAGTYDGTIMRIYVNGLEIDSLAHPVGGAIDQDSTMAVTLGDSPVGGRAFDGRLDDVQVFDRALDPSEVFNDYKGGRPAGIRIIRWVETR